MKLTSLLILLFLSTSCIHLPKAVTGSFAKEMCSCLYVVENELPTCLELTRQMFEVKNYTVNDNHKTVEANFMGTDMIAIYLSETEGCLLKDN